MDKNESLILIRANCNERARLQQPGHQTGPDKVVRVRGEGRAARQQRAHLAAEDGAELGEDEPA